MSVSLKKQDMPPAGGYAPINYKRIPAKAYLGGAATFGIYLAMTSIGFVLYGINFRIKKREQIEMRSARMAITPLLMAEKDREYLKQMRRNRDAETDLMKNVEGWEVGTLYGDPIFRTIPADSVIIEPSDGEWYAHTSRSDWWKRFRVHFYM